jgi:hypothetical protein
MLNEGDDICRDDLTDRRSFIRVTAAMLASILARASEAQSTEQAGLVEDLKGQAFAETQSVRRALNRAAPLYVRDLVGTETESRLTMRLGRDTTLKLRN